MSLSPHNGRLPWSLDLRFSMVTFFRVRVLQIYAENATERLSVPKSKVLVVWAGPQSDARRLAKSLSPVAGRVQYPLASAACSIGHGSSGM